MAPRPSIPALRRYATVAADAVASTSAAAAAAAAPAKQRVYPQRKAFLYNYYSHLLHRSQLVLLFQHANLSVADSTALRNAIATIPVPRPASLPADAPEPERATLTVARTGLLAPAVRNVEGLTESAGTILAPHLNGSTALLTCPSLSPTYVSQVLAVLQRTVKKAKRDEVPNKVVKQPEFNLVAGLLEGNRVLTPAEVTEVTKLPDLDGMRAQLLGLLEMPGRQLLGVLGQAGGGSLVRTLQGLEESLKPKEEEAK